MTLAILAQGSPGFPGRVGQPGPEGSPVRQPAGLAQAGLAQAGLAPTGLAAGRLVNLSLSVVLGTSWIPWLGRAFG